ncbi:Enhancer of polycomb-like protein 2 [Heterocephalus glaber]|uniref:Enhancer of polycomb-like protein 2 n=1 Tax=Heterocephalus glaber TaxID=10181 RepID=G5B7T6_HETGA|nr:Enhancer of polycomb-like protein 2 [Heterocephalus glaber]
MSKLSFRARALDAAKPLPIYRGKDMPDLNDCVSINRAVPQMPTGMEKEEESSALRSLEGAAAAPTHGTLRWRSSVNLLGRRSARLRPPCCCVPVL